MLIKVPSKETEAVVAALSQQVRKLPATLRRSLTWDRGLEMAKHKDFTVAREVQVYFCDPQSPWQRGSNENTNLLLRQYFPRGTDLSAYSQAQLDQVSLRLNQRPRKTLGFQTPAVNSNKVLRRPVELAGLIGHLREHSCIGRLCANERKGIRLLLASNLAFDVFDFPVATVAASCGGGRRAGAYHHDSPPLREHGQS
jgi:hypothetical protein